MPFPGRKIMKQCTRRVCGIILYGLLGLAESVDQPVYTDTLGSGWQDWSWAAVNLANMAPVYSAAGPSV